MEADGPVETMGRGFRHACQASSPPFNADDGLTSADRRQSVAGAGDLLDDVGMIDALVGILVVLVRREECL